MVVSAHGRPDHRSVLVSLVRVRELVADLAAGLAAAELAAELEAGVPVDADLAAVEDLQVETVHGLLRLLAGGVLDEAKAAGRLLLLVQAHYQTHNVSAREPKELKQLLFMGEERQVSHV